MLFDFSKSQGLPWFYFSTKSLKYINGGSVKTEQKSGRGF
jgi:hypothetical protein